MKKRLAVMLTLVLAFGVCAGCNKKNVDPPAAGAVMQEFVNDFETMKERDTIRPEGIGRCEWETDAQYVKSGDKSLKVIIDPFPEIGGGGGALYQAMRQIKNDRILDNFEDVRKLDMWVYSTSEVARPFKWNLMCTNGTVLTKLFTLEKGWNYLEYDVNRVYVPEFTTVEGETYRSVLNMRYVFDATDVEEVYYLDAVRIMRTEKPIVPIDIALETGEVASFDYDWQVDLAVTTGLYVDHMSGRLSRVREGDRSFCRVECPANNAGRGDWGAWCINDTQVGLVPWGEYRAASKLIFDYRIPEAAGIREFDLILRYFVPPTEGGKINWFSYPIMYQRPVMKTAAACDEWHTVEIPLGDIDTHYAASAANKTFADVARISFEWPETTTVAYFDIDNIRLVY